MSVSELEQQQAYRITGFVEAINPVYRHKLLSMGIRPGVGFRVVRSAPLGDPLQLQIGQLNVMLRKKDLDQLTFCVSTAATV